MNVELDAKTRRDLDLLAEAEGKDPGILLRELVHEAVARRRQGGDMTPDDAEELRRQQEALRDLHEELDALPPEGPDDGFSGRDHDKLLYGKRS